MCEGICYSLSLALKIIYLHMAGQSSIKMATLVNHGSIYLKHLLNANCQSKYEAIGSSKDEPPTEQEI